MARTAHTVATALVGIALTACTTGDETIGTTEWTVGVRKLRYPLWSIGAGGHAVGWGIGDTSMTFVSPTGELVWEASCDGECVTASVDAEGRVYRWDGNALVRHAADDGAVGWSVPIPGALSARIVAGAGEPIWLLADASGPIDLGGGTLEPDGETTCWAHLDGDGEHLASGCFERQLVLGSARAMSSGGLSAVEYTATYRRGVLVVLDADRAEVSRFESDGTICAAYVRDDGEISLLEAPTDSCGIDVRVRRLDVSAAELWRSGLDGVDTTTFLEGGDILVGGGDGLAGDDHDVGYLAHIDLDGNVTREIYEELVRVAEGAVLPGFRFSADGELVSRSVP